MLDVAVVAIGIVGMVVLDVIGRIGVSLIFAPEYLWFHNLCVALLVVWTIFAVQARKQITL